MEQNQTGGQGKPQQQLSWSQPTALPSQQQKSGNQGQQQTNQNPQPQKNSMNTRNTTPAGTSNVSRTAVWGFIGGIIIGFILGWIWFGTQAGNGGTGGAPTGTTTEENGNAPITGGTSTTTGGTSTTTGTGPEPSSATAVSITVPPSQPAGTSVTISSISTDGPVWAVVYEDREGQLGNALGAQRLTPEDTSGTVELLRRTLPNQTYYVGLVEDSSDRSFSVKTNAPIVDQNGNRIIAQFIAL